MNIVFFGSSNFAVPSLRALLTTMHTISCVVTQPDRQKDRGLSLSPTAIKKVGQDAGLKIYQPHRLNTPQTLKLLKDLKPDLFVTAAYGQILSQEVLDIPRIFSLNIHGSLLPKYRGAAPINWAIINGEKTTGVTIIKMVKDLDAGPIILQETYDIASEDTAISLEENLSGVGARLLLDSLKTIENNNYNLIPQDKDKASFAPKLKKEDGRINWNGSAYSICNLIRGCLPWPGAFTYYKGKLLKIYKVKVCQSFDFARDGSRDGELAEPLTALPVSQLPGEIIAVSKEGVIVATGAQNLIIEELQLEGKRIMKVKEFIAGHKISPGDSLGYPAPF